MNRRYEVAIVYRDGQRRTVARADGRACRGSIATVIADALARGDTVTVTRVDDREGHRSRARTTPTGPPPPRTAPDTEAS